MSTVDQSGNKHDARGRFAGHVATESDRGLEPIGPAAARTVQALRDAAHRPAQQPEPDTYDLEFDVVRETGKPVLVRCAGKDYTPTMIGTVRLPLSNGGSYEYNVATGRTAWLNADGRLHRGDGGPALRDTDGAEWHQHGVLHRDPAQGPAQVMESGEVVFTQHGADIFDRAALRNAGADVSQFEYDVRAGFRLSDEYLDETGDEWSPARYNVGAYLADTVPGWEE